MSQLLSSLVDKGVKLNDMATDSRKVGAGSLFLAYPGEVLDGRQFIAQAIERGAAAIVWEKGNFAWHSDWIIPNIGVTGLRQKAGFLADGFYGQPSKNLWTIGVTGTNGKTSCTYWLRHALDTLDRKTAVIGTLGNGFVDKQVAPVNTTPNPIELHQILADYLNQGAKSVAMEVSSHGLDQGRVNGVHFDVAVLTNLTRDHLDYHGSMEKYANAKRRLFDWDGLRCAVLNADDEFGRAIAKTLKSQGKQVLTYGLNEADVQGTNLHVDAHGLSMQIITPEGKAQLRVPIAGRFNAYNILAVTASLLASNVSLVKAVGVLATVKPVPGRMQRYGGGSLPLVVVDYAHTPDALENVLKSLGTQTNGRLICVFGCGGDRDPGKRPLMGEVATRLSSHTVITSDNPRNENPLDIIQSIVSGASGEFIVEPDRTEAITLAILSANAGDVVLVAGKGHEEYQEIAGVKHPFSDASVVEKVLKDLSV